MISIIIPTYNEKENIKKLILKINKVVKKEFEIIVVDDNSPDGTGKIVDRLKRYNARCIRRKGKLGLSSAVINGFEKAKGDIIGVIDADFSHPPEKINELVKALDHADLAIGSRYVKGGGIRNWPLIRKLISRAATLLSLPLTTVKDPMSGFFFFRRNVIKDVKLNAKGFKILLEIIVKGKYKEVKEVPFIFVDRREGTSKLNKKEYIDYLRNLVSLLRYKFT